MPSATNDCLTNLSSSHNITFPDPFSFKGCYHTLMCFSSSLSTAMVSGSECRGRLQNTRSVIRDAFYDWLTEMSSEHKTVELASHAFWEKTNLSPLSYIMKYTAITCALLLPLFEID